MRMTAAFDTQWARFPRLFPGMPAPITPATDAMLTIAPPPRRSKTGSACLTARKISVTSFCMVQSKSSRVSTSMVPLRIAAALL